MDADLKRLEEIHYSLTARVDEIIEPIMSLITEAMGYLPDEVVDYVIDNVTFRSGCAFTPKEYILEGGIISLDDNLIDEGKDKAIYLVLHEIAHAYLKHRMDCDLEEDIRQEKDADELARKWLI